MKQLIALSMAAMIACPSVWAQEATPGAPEASDGFNLMQEGARLFMEGMMSEMQPAIDELTDLAEEMEPALRAFAEEMGPALMELMTLVDDIRFYEMPEFLENGDIIIRRRADAPPYVLPESDPIDL